LTDGTAAGLPDWGEDDLFRRVRNWNLSSWRHADRIAQTRSALSSLAAQAATYDGIPRPAVPDVGVHALADQLQVLTMDALEAGVPADEIRTVLARLARDLGLANT
jgi:hypothetical protein